MSASTDMKSDLRSTSRDRQRAAAHKAKWARGVHLAPGRPADAHPRPARVSDHFAPSSHRQRVSGSTTKSAQANADDMMAARAEYNSIARHVAAYHNAAAAAAGSSDEGSAGSDSDDSYLSDAAIAGPGSEVVLGGDEERGPATGTQVLGSALAKAVRDFEDKETVRLVESEYSVLDDEGEEMGFSPVKKGKRSASSEKGLRERATSVDEDYEIV